MSDPVNDKEQAAAPENHEPVEPAAAAEADAPAATGVAVAPAKAPDAVSNGVVCFVMQRCPFCSRIRVLLDAMGIEVRYIDAFDEASAENRDLYAETVKATEHQTLPLVLINGELLGGCDDTCMAVDSGRLQRMLNLPTVKSAIPADGMQRAPAWTGLFMFPPVVNRWAVQVTGLVAMSLSIVAMVHREDAWAHWLVVGMGIDYFVRMVAGGHASIKGSFALPFAALLQEELAPGVSKQFAAACGFFFCALASFLFIAGEDGSDTSEIGGTVVIGILCGCAAAEGFGNVCVGCIVFGIMNKLRIVPDTVYQSYTDLLGMFIYQISDQNRKNGWTSAEPLKVEEGATDTALRKDLMGWRRQYGNTHDPVVEPVRVQPALHPSGLRSQVDYEYKFPKTDDTIREHFGVKYVQFEDFGFPLGVTGFAAALRAVHDMDGFQLPFRLWQTIGLIGACIHGLLLIAYLVKLALAPSKVYSDLQDTSKRTAMIIIPITHLLFAFLLEPQAGDDYTTSRVDLQSTVFWAGLVGVGLHFVTSVATWFKRRTNEEHVNPSYLFPAAGPLVVAMVAPLIAPDRGTGYTEVGAWFLGLGLFFYMLLTATTFSQGLVYHWSDDRVRPMITLWTAGAFLANVAYTTMTGLTTWDVTAWMFWAAGVSLFLVNFYLVYPGRWLLRGRFEMSNWAIAFACDTFVFAAAGYRRAVGHEFSAAVLWIALVFAGWSNFTMFFHTLALLVLRKWPRAPQKWSPMSFNKLQHEAMRVMIDKIRAEAEHPTPESAEEADKYLSRLMEQWDEYFDLTVFHAFYEDEVLLPELKGYNFTQIHPCDEQHEQLEAQLGALAELKKDVSSEKRDNVTEFKRRVVEHVEQMLDHIQWEEDHMTPIIRKNINLKMLIEIIRNTWASARSLAEMEAAIVAVVKHLPMHGQRVRFIKALTWALPERSQQIGTWLYRGLGRDPLGDMKFSMLIDDMPEIAPRGTFGWSKIA